MSNSPFSSLGYMLGGVGNMIPQGYISAYPPYDKRTDREKLMGKLEVNKAMIEDKLKENEEINEALAYLDEHPVIEKMNNLIKRLVG